MKKTAPMLNLPAAKQPVVLPTPTEDKPISIPLWSIWLVGALLSSIRPLIGAFQARCLIRSASVAPSDLLLLANACAHEQGYHGPIRVLTSPEVESALAWGYLKPVVMLPSSASQWSQDDSRTIFLHEFAHLARRDWLAQALASAVCSLYWFNPFVWALAGRLRKEAERAADDLVLRSGVAPEAYATCLIQIARQLRSRPRPAGVAPILDPTQIEIRIRGIMNKKINRGGITPLRSLAIVAVVALATLPLAAVFPYRLEILRSSAKPVSLSTQPVETSSHSGPLQPAPVAQKPSRPSNLAEVPMAKQPERIASPKVAERNTTVSEEARWSPILPQGVKVVLQPYTVDLAGIAKRDQYNVRFIKDSYTVVTPNLKQPLSVNIDMSAWPAINPAGIQTDGGCIGPVGYDGFVILPAGSSSIDWDRLEVKVVNSEYVALVLPTGLNDSLVRDAVASLRKSLEDARIESKIEVFRDNGRGYIFLPGNKDYLGEQQAFIEAYKQQYLKEKKTSPGAVEGLKTSLPPTNFFSIKADDGYIWITPNVVESAGKRHLIRTPVAGYPRQVQSNEPNTAAAGRSGGTFAAIRPEGYFIRQSGALNADYSRAETILLDGQFTLLVVPEDVSDEDIQKTINEVYQVNNTNADDSPIKVVRQRKEGLIVLPGPNDELMQASARVANAF